MEDTSSSSHQVLSNVVVDLENLQTKEKCQYHPPGVGKKISEKTLYGIGCQKNQCHSAMMDKINLPHFEPNRSQQSILVEAKEFLSEFYRDEYAAVDDTKEFDLRWKQVESDIKTKGYYFHTAEELSYGVKLAWRNSSRCIMRIQWKNIKVIDARGPDAGHAKNITNEEVYEKCLEHLRSAIEIDENGNKVIRSQMTVFPQLLPGEEVGCKIWNPQLLRFAGYRQLDGSIVGDPANEEFTKACCRLGWDPNNRDIPLSDVDQYPQGGDNRSNRIQKQTAFDLLPLVIQTPASSLSSTKSKRGILVKELPADCQVLVPILHPDYPEFNKLGIKWHAVPAISNFILDIGGIQYPCTPFNGWYMGSEIASRNLGDIQRYNLLPKMAEIMQLPTSSNRDLWRDKALVELNRAVLYSFEKEKVTIVDHITASESFIRHHSKEIETRGFIPADWVWLVPPIGGSINPVFHQEMINFFIKPNFLPPPYTFEKLLTLARENCLLPQEENNTKLKNSNPMPSLEGVHLDDVDVSPSTNDESLKSDVYIFFGSETGVSESYAHRIKARFESQQSSKLYNAKMYGGLELLCLETFLVSSKNKRRTILIIVTSTFGSGGPPGNAEEFNNSLIEMCRKKKENEIQRLEGDHVQLFLLGVGSSLYANFNGFAKTVRKNMTTLGVNSIVYEEADEYKNPEVSVDKFMKEIGEKLNIKDFFNSFKGNPHGGLGVSKKHPPYEVVMSNVPSIVDPSNRTISRLSSTSYLRSSSTRVSKVSCPGFVSASLASRDIISKHGSEREVLLLKFHIETRSNGLNGFYNEGDHCAIYPKNDESVVEQLLAIFKLDGEKYLKVQSLDFSNETDNIQLPSFLQSGRNRIREIFTNFIDLNAAPSYKFIKAAANHATPGTREKVMLDYYSLDIAKYQKWVEEMCPSHLTIFEIFPSLVQTFPLNEFLYLSKRISPRFYSIASSPVVERDEIHLVIRSTFLQEKVGCPSSTSCEVKNRRGLCSSYLWRMPLSSTLEIEIYPFPKFSVSPQVPPSSPQIPLIMVANGTGIAPFRGIWRTIVSNSNLQNDTSCSNSPSPLFGGRLSIFEKLKKGKEKLARVVRKKNDFQIQMPSGGQQAKYNDGNLRHIVLFYGCRGSSEHLFKKEMEDWLVDLQRYDLIQASIFVCYSREADNPNESDATLPFDKSYNITSTVCSQNTLL